MFFKDKFKKDDSADNYIVALDVGTELAKALIARVDRDKLSVVGVGRARQDLGSMYSGAVADITGVVKNCEIALTQAEEQAGLQARKAVVGIAGEFVKGITNTIRYRRPNADRPLDDNEMRLIIEKIEERSAKRAQRQIAIETGNPDVEVKLINSALVGIHIDGYKVTNPIGFQGRDVVVQIYTAFAPMVHIGALERVASELDLDLLAVAAEPFAVARAVLGTDGNSSFSAILCDIGGGTSDVAVVNDGGVEGTKMFGVAGRSFTKTIERSLNISYEAAERLKVNIDNPRIKPSVRKKLDTAVDETIDVWMAGFEMTLSEFDAVDQLPSRILMCGGGSSLDRLPEKLSEETWYRGLPFTKKPKVHLITPDDVKDIEDETGDVRDHTMITALGLLRVGYDTMVGVDDDNSIIGRINKTLRI